MSAGVMAGGVRYSDTMQEHSVARACVGERGADADTRWLRVNDACLVS